MKGYSKIKLKNNYTKSRSMSMDLSDETITTPRLQKPDSIKKPTSTVTQPQRPNIQYDDDDDDDYKHYSSNQQEQADDNFPMKMLTKNQSVVTSNGTKTDEKGISSRFKIEKQNSTGRALHTSVISALSIRRSSSVSERYSRIHDQYSTPFYVDDYHEEQEEEMKKGRSKDNLKKQNKGSILKACKRIFGL